MHYLTPTMTKQAKGRLLSILKNPIALSGLAALPVTYGEYQGWNPVAPGLKNRDPSLSEFGVATGLNALSMMGLTAGVRSGVAKGKFPKALGLSGLSTLFSTPAISLSNKGLTALDESGDSVTGWLSDQARSGARRDNARLLLGAGLGAGALGLGALGLNEARKARQQAEKPKEVRDPGLVRITLPTSDPNDRETQIELPLDHAKLTQTAVNQLRRDLRRRLRYEGQERTMSRGQIPDVWADAKAASTETELTGRIRRLQTLSGLWEKQAFPRKTPSYQQDPTKTPGHPTMQAVDFDQRQVSKARTDTTYAPTYSTSGGARSVSENAYNQADHVTPAIDYAMQADQRLYDRNNLGGQPGTHQTPDQLRSQVVDRQKQLANISAPSTQSNQTPEQAYNQSFTQAPPPSATPTVAPTSVPTTQPQTQFQPYTLRPEDEGYQTPDQRFQQTSRQEGMVQGNSPTMQAGQRERMDQNLRARGIMPSTEQYNQQMGMRTAQVGMPYQQPAPVAPPVVETQTETAGGPPVVETQTETAGGPPAAEDPPVPARTQPVVENTPALVAPPAAETQTETAGGTSLGRSSWNPSRLTGTLANRGQDFWNNNVIPAAERQSIYSAFGADPASSNPTYAGNTYEELNAKYRRASDRKTHEALRAELPYRRQADKAEEFYQNMQASGFTDPKAFQDLALQRAGHSRMPWVDKPGWYYGRAGTATENLPEGAGRRAWDSYKLMGGKPLFSSPSSPPAPAGGPSATAGTAQPPGTPAPADAALPPGTDPYRSPRQRRQDLQPSTPPRLFNPTLAPQVSRTAGSGATPNHPSSWYQPSFLQSPDTWGPAAWHQPNFQTQPPNAPPPIQRSIAPINMGGLGSVPDYQGVWSASQGGSGANPNWTDPTSSIWNQTQLPPGLQAIQ